ncbi:TPA: phage portal protein [Escherichia coli]
MTSLREYAGYHGGGSGFGGQLRAWNPPGESVDAALLPNFTRGNARADDLVRNNGYAANAIQLHQDHIVGSFFRLSHRPSWRYLGIGEEEARAFSREVEAAWKEFAEDDCCCIDVERKRTFTMMIREGVAMHAFNGELFVQATWDTSSSRLFRTQFRMVSPKRISNPNNTGDSRNCRAGVQINDSGAALGYYVSEDGYPGWMPQKWTWIPRELPGGRASFIHVFEPVEDGQTRGANVFYSVMEQMKMLDTLQNTQLQSAIVKAMYAATIESELDTQSAMDFILGANSQEQRERLTGWIGEIAAYYAAAPVRLGGAKVPHLMPGDSLNLQTAQDTDNGYSVFEQSLLRYIAAGLGVSYEQLSRNYAQMSYSTARASANESWAYFMGRRKFVASRQASQMFLCWLEIDLTEVGGERYFFCNEQNEKGEPVTWQGRQYQAYPIQGTGFELNGKGSAARPTLTVSNLHGMVTGMAEDLQSLVGGTVVRRKVYARFLDAVNFVNGNSDADPEQEVISRWRIEQCSELSAVSASFVLATPTETDGAVFPGRIMLANTCTWTYRGDECGYHGPAVADEYDQPTSDITKDKCSKCLSGCKFRNNVGNFGGFLSINKLSQ